MKFKLGLISVLIYSLNSMAIYGDYIDESYHPEQTCLLELGTEGTCSATLIKQDVIISANHCFSNLKSKEEQIKVRCHRSNEIRHVINVTLLGDNNDLALAKLNKPLEIEPMSIAHPSIIERIKRDGTSNYFCSFFGYGLDNEFKTKRLHGILSNNSSVSIDKSFQNQIRWDELIIEQVEKILNKSTSTAERESAEAFWQYLRLPVVIEPKYANEQLTKSLRNKNVAEKDFNNFLSHLQNLIESKVKDMSYEFLQTPEKHYEYIQSQSSNSDLPPNF